MTSPHRIPTPEPHPRAFGAYSDLSPEARQLLAAITADMARLRSLERLPTHASVAWARVAIPGLRDLLDRLGRDL